MRALAAELAALTAALGAAAKEYLAVERHAAGGLERAGRRPAVSLSLDLVRTWDAGACDEQSRRLFHLADDLDRAYERLCRTEADLAGWRGPAADFGRPRVRRAAVAASRLAGALRQAADALRSGLAALSEAVRLARTPAQSPGDGAQALALASSVDARVAASLLVAAAAGRRPTASPPVGPALPAPDATPAEVARWWTALRARSASPGAVRAPRSRSDGSPASRLRRATPPTGCCSTGTSGCCARSGTG